MANAPSAFDILLTPAGIASLAKSLHLQRGTHLTTEYGDLDLESHSSSDWSIERTQITFASLEVRNQCVASLVFGELTQNATALVKESLFDAARSLWRYETNHKDKASGRLLALASTQTNIFSWAVELIGSGHQRPDDILHLMEAAIPYVSNVSAEELLALIEATNQISNDTTRAGYFLSVIEKDLIERPELARNLFGLIKAQASEFTSSTYSLPVLVLAKTGNLEEAVGYALEDAQLTDSLLLPHVLWSIGRLLVECELSADQVALCMATLRQHVQTPHAGNQNRVVHAMALAAAKHYTLLPDLLEMANSKDQEVLSTVAVFLFRHEEAIRDHEKFPELLRTLIQLSPDNTHGINSFDWVLSKLVGHAEFEPLSYLCLTEWIILHGNALRDDKNAVALFDQTIHEYVARPELFARLITQWLIADEVALCTAYKELISHLWARNVREPVFSKEILDQLDAGGLLYLARRMLGYTHSEEALLSLTFSLLNTHDAKQRTFGLVYSLLLQEVGQDYLQAVLTMIDAKHKEADPDSSALLDSVRTKLTAYAKALDDLPRLEELRPPTQLRKALLSERQKSMRISMEEAHEKSFFRQFMTQVPLKAGVGWFSIENGNVGDTNYLQSLSQAVSLPRRYVSDPVGYAISGINFRGSKRGDE